MTDFIGKIKILAQYIFGDVSAGTVTLNNSALIGNLVDVTAP